MTGQKLIYRFHVYPDSESFPICVDRLFHHLGNSAEAEFPSEETFEHFRSCLKENGFLLKSISRIAYSEREEIE